MPPAEPDPLLPPTVWLFSVLPPPQFPAATAARAFPPEDVVGSKLEVATRAFGLLEDWGYKIIGRYDDRRNDIELIGYSSKFATIWVLFFGGCLSVLVTAQGENDPSRLNHHLAAAGKARTAAWGAFPVEARHVPAAAREFLRISESLLRGGAPDFARLTRDLDAAASTFSRAIWKEVDWAEVQKLAAGGRHRAAVRILEFWEQELLPQQLDFLGKERWAALAEPTPIQRGGESDRDWFIARANHMTAMEVQLKAAVIARDKSAEAAAAHSALAVAFHDATDFLYGDLERAVSRSREGDNAATEYLVTFLEADLWCFRSGYMKGRLYERLRQVELDEGLEARIGAVLLRAVDMGYRMEFRSACRLARRLADPQLIRELRRRLQAPANPHVRRRALWMLDYLRNGLQQQDREAVLEVVLDSAKDKDWYRVSTWVRPLCRRFADDAFASRIRTLAVSSNEWEARIGLRLLPCALREPLNAGERLVLERVILDAVHERGPGAGLVEGLSAVADTMRLRARLVELAKHGQSPANRYAKWGLNSAIRANGEDAPDL